MRYQTVLNLLKGLCGFCKLKLNIIPKVKVNHLFDFFIYLKICFEYRADLVVVLANISDWRFCRVQISADESINFNSKNRIDNYRQESSVVDAKLLFYISTAVAGEKSAVQRKVGDTVSRPGNNSKVAWKRRTLLLFASAQ